MYRPFKFKTKPYDDQLIKAVDWLNKLRLASNFSKNERSNSFIDQTVEGNACYLKTKGEFCPLTCHVAQHGITTSPNNPVYRKTNTKEEQTLRLGDYTDIKSKGIATPLTCDIGWVNTVDSAKNAQVNNLKEMKKVRPSATPDYKSEASSL